MRAGLQRGWRAGARRRPTLRARRLAPGASDRTLSALAHLTCHDFFLFCDISQALSFIISQDNTQADIRRHAYLSSLHDNADVTTTTTRIASDGIACYYWGGNDMMALREKRARSHAK